jgi:hypothetical protein
MLCRNWKFFLETILMHFWAKWKYHLSRILKYIPGPSQFKFNPDLIYFHLNGTVFLKLCWTKYWRFLESCCLIRLRLHSSNTYSVYFQREGNCALCIIAQFDWILGQIMFLCKCVKNIICAIYFCHVVLSMDSNWLFVKYENLLTLPGTFAVCVYVYKSSSINLDFWYQFLH